MTLQELRERLDVLHGVGRCYGPFPEQQEVPYITYHSTQTETIYADGKPVYATEPVTLDLVTRRRDLDLEAALERILCEGCAQFDKSMNFDDVEEIHTATYIFETEVQ